MTDNRVAIDTSTALDNRTRSTASETALDPWQDVHPRGWVVALPRLADRPGVGDYLGEVDDLITEVLADLTHVWTTQLDDRGDVDILEGHDLPQLLDELIATGGKRIRPVMSYLGWLSAGGKDEGGHEHVVRLGAALELLHMFALIHDDVMDESASRRGQPTVHAQAAGLHVSHRALGSAQRFGDSIAILVGDLAHAEADYLAAGLPPQMRRLWRLLVVELVCGQRRDLTGGAAGRRDLAHARQVARMKSGAYTVQRPLQLGAAAAGASAVVVDRLATYGREIGEAFALRDDLLGVWGDPTRTGKPAGDDLVSGKPTVIMSLADERLTGAHARAALGRTGSPALTRDDIRLLQRELETEGVVAAVEELISGHVAGALDALQHSSLDSEGVTQLTQMAHQIAWRDR